MKPPDYRIRISQDAVSVQHRVTRPSWELCLLIPVYALIIYLNDGFKILAELLRAREWRTFCVALLLNGAFVLFFTWSWLVYSSGEFLHCDANGLQLAKRLVWTRWGRKTFGVQSVSHFCYAFRGGSKTRSYSVLTFLAAGKRNDILEEISIEDALHILEACRKFGFDCVLPEIFPNHDGPMKADIAKRGWLVNPWRPDDIETHPKGQP